MTAVESEDTETAPRRHPLVLLVLLALVGANLRTVMLGVPPVLPLVQHDLDLSHTATGFLTALPVLMMGGMAWASGWLADRLGGRVTVAAGLLLLGAGAALRGVWPSAVPLYVFTGVLSLGVAVAQTSVPVLVRQWFPRRIGLASALYTDGLIVGEAVAAGVTLPLMQLWFGPGAWRASFVAWSVPVAVTLVLWALFSPATPPTVRRLTARVSSPSAAEPLLAERPRRHVSVLHLGLLSGSGSLIYFAMNTWIPPYDTALGHGDATALALGTLNAVQLPVSLALTFVAQRLLGRRLPFVVSGTICLLALVGWVSTPIGWQVLWAALFGGAAVAVLVLGSALAPLLAERHEVARLVGATLSISYALGFFGPLAGGWLWDLLGRPGAAFIPVALGTIGLIVFGATLPHAPRPPAVHAAAPDAGQTAVPDGS